MGKGWCRRERILVKWGDNPPLRFAVEPYFDFTILIRIFWGNAIVKPSKGTTMKLNIKALALAAGIAWGLAILLLTYWFLLMGYEGETLSRLSNVYLGYSVTWYGGFIGLAWGFVDGLIGGAVLAWLYNRFVPKPAEAPEGAAI